MPITPRDIGFLRDILSQLVEGLTTSDSGSLAKLTAIETLLGNAATDAKLEAVRALLAGTLTTRAIAATSATGTVGALNAAVTLAVPQGTNSVTFYSTTLVAFVGTLTPQISFDGGATYINLAVSRSDITSGQTSSIGSAQIPYVIATPPGATHVRAIATAYTSGSLSTIVSAGVSNMLPTLQTVTLGGAAGRIGFVAGSGVWFNHSTTTLAGAATFTGASIDATVSATGTTFANAATYAKEVNALAHSDVTGTLHLEVSHDNFATAARRIRSVATTLVGAVYVAELSFKPCTRYWRLVYVNGAGAQTTFLLNSIAMAA